jgi:hypothetical protein
VDLVDPPGEPPQRLDVGRDGQLVKVLSLPGEQADIELLATEIESSVQHVKRASLVRRGLVNTAQRFTNGGPSSWQSGAVANDVSFETPACRVASGSLTSPSGDPR